MQTEVAHGRTNDGAPEERLRRRIANRRSDQTAGDDRRVVDKRGESRVKESSMGVLNGHQQRSHHQEHLGGQNQACHRNQTVVILDDLWEDQRDKLVGKHPHQDGEGNDRHTDEPEHRSEGPAGPFRIASLEVTTEYWDQRDRQVGACQQVVEEVGE